MESYIPDGIDTLSICFTTTILHRCAIKTSQVLIRSVLNRVLLFFRIFPPSSIPPYFCQNTIRIKQCTRIIISSNN